MERKRKANELNFEKKIDDIIGVVEFAKAQHNEVKRLNEILKKMIQSAGGHLWMKDLQGRYIYCDPTWCEVFFRMPSDCEIEGFTDWDLLAEFREDGSIHTFGDVCYGTDKDCIERKEQSHYVELGWIKDELFILDVIKTPVFTNGELVGTVGFARNLSSESNWICDEIRKLLNEGQAEVIYKQDNNVAAYKINRINHGKGRKCLNTFPGPNVCKV